MVAADLADSGPFWAIGDARLAPTATTAAELAAKTQKAKLGQVSAFFSTRGATRTRRPAPSTPR